MAPAEALAHLTAAGIRLESSAGMILATPRAALTDEHRALIRGYKPALLALLAPKPPPLTVDRAAAVTGSAPARASVGEPDTRDPRARAETQAQATVRAYRLLVAMGGDEPPKWLTLIAPGCDFAEATRTAQGQFGAARLLEIHERGNAGAKGTP